MFSLNPLKGGNGSKLSKSYNNFDPQCYKQIPNPLEQSGREEKCRFVLGVYFKKLSSGLY